MDKTNSSFAKTLAWICTFSFSSAQILLVALFPVLAENLRLDLSTLIATFSLGSFLFIVGSPYWSQKSDVIGRKRVLQIGMIALSVSLGIITYLVYNPFFDPRLNWTLLLLSRVVYGLVASGIAPTAQSWLADLSHSQHSSQAMLTHSISLNFGRVIGVGSILMFRSSYGNVIAFYCALAAIVFSSLALSSQSQTLNSQSEFTIRNATALPLSWRNGARSIKWILWIAFVFSTFMEALNTSLAGTIQKLFQIGSLDSSQITARVLLAASLGILAVQIVGRVLANSLAKIGFAIGVLALIVGSYVLLRIESMSQLWVSIGFLTIGIGLVPPFYLSHLRNKTLNSPYGQRAGMVGSIHALGYAFGGVISAWTFKSQLHAGAVLLPMALSLGIFTYLQYRSLVPATNQEFA